MSQQIRGQCGNCCCCKRKNLSRPPSRDTNYRDVSLEERNECVDRSSSRGDRSYINNIINNTGFEMDDESWHALSYLRQRICRPERSDTDYASSTDTPLSPERQDQYGTFEMMRRANDALDYVPESDFLRKMKQQCQFLRNCQPNIFSTLDEFIRNRPTVDDQKGSDIPNPALECRKEGGNAPRLSPGTQYQGTDNQVQISPRPRPCMCSRASQVGEELEERTRNEQRKVSRGKSEHIFRPRKQVIRCRGRRKRKSTSSERCELENEFEPTLKKPHENSCERCWRYASPARSPVNKPDQRFDPNFRRGHSCMDLQNEVEGQIRKVSSPCKHIHHPNCRQREESPPTPTQSPQAENCLQHPQTPKVRIFVQEPESGGCPVHPQPSKIKILIEPPVQRPQARSCSEQSPQRPQTGNRLGPSPQKPRTESNFEECSQRNRAGYVGEVPCASGQRIQGASMQHGRSPTTEQPSTPLPPSYNFTKVKELMFQPQTQVHFDRCGPKTQDFENFDTNRTGVPAPQRTIYSDPVRRPRPKSYTSGMPFGDPGIATNTNNINYKDICSSPKRFDFESKNFSSKFLGASECEVPSRAGKNISNSLNISSPCKNCEHCKSQPSPQARANSLFRFDPTIPQLKSPQELKKTPLKAASAGSSVSPAKEISFSNIKKPATGAPKRGKSKSPSPKCKQEVVRSFKRSPQKSKSPKPSTSKAKSPKSSPCKPKSPKSTPCKSKSPNSSFSKKESPKPCPSKTESQHAVPRKLISSAKKKPQSAGPALNRSSSECENAGEAFVPSHPIRECDCFPRVAGPECDNVDGNIFCCHCNWKEDLSNPNNKNSYKLPTGVPLSNEIDQLLNDTDETVYAEICADLNYRSPTGRPCNCVRNSPRSSFPENQRVKHEILECPYRRFGRLVYSSTAPQSATEDCGGSALGGNRQQLPRKGFPNPQVSEPNPRECSPRKYIVFYTTKSKEKNGKDDVEVLVEELSRSCPDVKDTRTKDITEKMKKILECPSDSMALRFQKGVSEACRTPRSSRILYF